MLGAIFLKELSGEIVDQLARLLFAPFVFALIIVDRIFPALQQFADRPGLSLDAGHLCTVSCLAPCWRALFLSAGWMAACPAGASAEQPGREGGGHGLGAGGAGVEGMGHGLDAAGLGGEGGLQGERGE